MATKLQDTSISNGVPKTTKKQLIIKNTKISKKANLKKKDFEIDLHHKINFKPSHDLKVYI